LTDGSTPYKIICCPIREAAKVSCIRAISIESLRKEADKEITNENAGSKILADLRSINLNWLDYVSPNVVLRALIAKLGFMNSCSVSSSSVSVRVVAIRGGS